MSIPTVNVTVVIFSQDGNAVKNISVKAVLSSVEKYNGMIVADNVTSSTDAAGTAILVLFPNVLGTNNTYYRFYIHNPSNGQTTIVKAEVPNNDCNLWDIGAIQ